MTEASVSKGRMKSPKARIWVREKPAWRRIWVAMLATAGAAAAGLGLLQETSSPAWARKGSPCHSVSEQVSALKVTLNKSRTLCFSDPFSTAVIGAPEIADVLPMTDSMLYVQGKKVGATNISVFDQQRRLVSVIDLDVTPDTTSLQNKIAASTGGRDINVTSANGQIVLSGEASDGLAAARAVEVAKGLSPDAQVVNAMKVSPSQQVMLKVRILEVDRNAGRDLGISWFGKTNSVSFATGLGSQPTTATNNSGVFPGAGSTASSFGVLLANVVNTHGVSIDALLSALETKGLVKSLAEPDLVALSGEKATFLAGGEIPVPVVQGTNATNTTLGIGVNYTPNISIEWKQFGVGLDFTPTVLNNGIINLQLNPSVTEINTANSLNINGTTVPSLTERKAHTAVELRDGQSFAIAGLLQAQDSQSINQLPWLGNVPVLGALFRSTDFQKSQTDLVIIVSPHLVKPVRPGQHLATPFDTALQSNDVDLFLMGDTDRKKRYTDYVTSGGGLQGPYGHILAVSDFDGGSVERSARRVAQRSCDCTPGHDPCDRRLLLNRRVRRPVLRLPSANRPGLDHGRQRPGGEYRGANSNAMAALCQRHEHPSEWRTDHEGDHAL
jgi:pilus assembly protein CpaC